jgi:hypothetical protein
MRMSNILLVAATLSLAAVSAYAGPKSASTDHGGTKAVTTHGNSVKAKPSAPAPSSTTHATATLNPIAQKISTNRGLQPKVRALLPPGMTLNQASLGFKNQGQFLAALHVSRNLGIPFADLKTAMTGVRPTTTGAPGGTGTTASPATLSLGQAIHKLRPSADTVAATTPAEHQASAELRVTSPATASTATTTTTSKKKSDK